MRTGLELCMKLWLELIIERNKGKGGCRGGEQNARLQGGGGRAKDGCGGGWVMAIGRGVGWAGRGEEGWEKVVGERLLGG
ncbi:unnamed protein product [Prunus armeniaca]